MPNRRWPALLLVVLLEVLVRPTEARPEVPLCSETRSAVGSGITVCDGRSAPVTITAGVQSTATVSLLRVLGGPPTGLTVTFDRVDAFCRATPAPAVSCSAGTDDATWYGDIVLRAQISGLGSDTRAKVVGVRGEAGNVPADQLLDGPQGTVPTRRYPPLPETPMTLHGGLTNGTSDVTRSIGVRVRASDRAGAWSAQVHFSVVIE